LITGIVFNIQKYSIHDGPGIRTTVFLKGCPLDCWWCHNPESKKQGLEIIYWPQKCLGCGSCINVCPQKAIYMEGGSLEKNKELCLRCGKCSKFCPTEAMELVGKQMTIDQVMKEIEKDKIFYDESKGGVTFSGGEPLTQPEFLYGLLQRCKGQGIHTAVDTSGLASWEVLSKIIKGTDLFLYDIKHLDDEAHKKYTGVSNQLILGNLKKLAYEGAHINIRMPIIPGINDDDENIVNTALFITSLNINLVNILPYHHTGADKYGRLGELYRLSDVQSPSDERMLQIQKRMKEFGLNVRIGG